MRLRKKFSHASRAPPLHQLFMSDPPPPPPHQIPVSAPEWMGVIRIHELGDACVEMARGIGADVDDSYIQGSAGACLDVGGCNDIR